MILFLNLHPIFFYLDVNSKKYEKIVSNDFMVIVGNNQARSQDFEMGGQPWILSKQWQQSGRIIFNWFKIMQIYSIKEH